MTTLADRTRTGTHTAAVLTALAVTVLWSSSWVLIRVGLDDEELDPLTFAGLRYFGAALLLSSWVLARRPTRALAGEAVRRHGRRLVMLGLVFYAVTQGAQFVAIDRQPAATTSLLLSLTPLVVAVAARRTLSERATRRQLTGATLVVIGAALFFAGDLGATPVGVVAAIVGLGANAAASLLGRDINRDRQLPPVVVTAVSMAIGSVVLLGVGVAIEGWPRPSARAVLIIVWLAVVNTAIANTLWNRSLRHLDAVESAGINNTMLIQIAALGWIVLDEAPGAFGVVGVVVVSCGVFLTQRATLRRPAVRS